MELDLQQTERDLLAKRDVIAKADYDKMAMAFQKRSLIFRKIFNINDKRSTMHIKSTE